MTYLEDRILKIIELRESGLDKESIGNKLGLTSDIIDRYESSIKKTLLKYEDSGRKLESITKATGFSTFGLEVLFQYYKINISSKRDNTKSKTRGYMKREKRVKQIKQFVKTGMSFNEIVEETGLTERTLRVYFYRNRRRLEDTLELIRQSIEDGARYAEDVAEIAGIGTMTLASYSKKYKIKIPPFFDKKNRYSPVKIKRYSIYDELIKKGFDLYEIGRRIGVSGERVRQYILSTGQYEIWEEARRKFKITNKEEESQRLEAIGALLSQAGALEKKRLRDQDQWAYEKTEEFLSAKKRRKGKINDFEKIYSIMQDYHSALERGKKISITYFTKKHNLIEPTIGKIFKEAGLKPLCRPIMKKREVISKPKKELLKRAMNTNFSIKTIAYFLNVPYYVASDYRFKNNPKKKRHNPFLRIDNTGSRLTLKKASEIYEALECCFSKDEIMDSFKVDEETYEFAIFNRSNTSKDIVKGLRIIFPDRNIRKPWREFRI